MLFDHPAHEAKEARALRLASAIEQAGRATPHVTCHVMAHDEEFVTVAPPASRQALASLGSSTGNDPLAALRFAVRRMRLDPSHARWMILLREREPTGCTSEELARFARQASARHGMRISIVNVYPLRAASLDDVDVSGRDFDHVARRFLRWFGEVARTLACVS